MAVKVTLDIPLARHLKYSRGTEVFIQWRDPDSRVVYGLSFPSSDAADGFQQWMDYATNPPATAAAPTSKLPAGVQAYVSGESHYQRPHPQPAPSRQHANNAPDVIHSHQQSVHNDIL